MKFPIGSCIKLFRIQHKMTQRELAEKLFISDRTISAYENGMNEPDLTTLCKIASCFSISLSELIRRGEKLMNIRKSNFYIDALETYEGYTFGQHWNGFECPSFTKEEGLKIVESWCKLSKKWNPNEKYTGWYDQEKDSFCFKDPNHLADDSLEPEVYEGFDVNFEDNKLHLYPIGSFAWIWEEDK